MVSSKSIRLMCDLPQFQDIYFTDHSLLLELSKLINNKISINVCSRDLCLTKGWYYSDLSLSSDQFDVCLVFIVDQILSIKLHRGYWPK